MSFTNLTWFIFLRRFSWSKKLVLEQNVISWSHEELDMLLVSVYFQLIPADLQNRHRFHTVSKSHPRNKQCYCMISVSCQGITLQGTKISHLGKRNIIFKRTFKWGYVSSRACFSPLRRTYSPPIPVYKLHFPGKNGWHILTFFLRIRTRQMAIYNS